MMLILLRRAFSRVRGALPSERGQALVEFALIMPFMLILIMAVLDFGRAWNIQHVITDAARETARVGVIANYQLTWPADTATNVAHSSLLRGALDTVRANVTTTGFRGGYGLPFTVQVEYPYQLGLLGAVLQWTTGQSSITLRSVVQMRNE